MLSSAGGEVPVHPAATSGQSNQTQRFLPTLRFFHAAQAWRFREVRLARGFCRAHTALMPFPQADPGGSSIGLSQAATCQPSQKRAEHRLCRSQEGADGDRR
jgi:hypothetical protein